MKTKKTLKRLIKLLISIIYYLVYIGFRFIITAAGKKYSSCVVICYHNIPERYRIRFIRQLSLIEKYTKPVSAQSKQEETGSDSLIITFDDIHQSVFKNAVPEMLSRGIPFTLFIPAGYIGKEPAWENIDQEANKDKIIDTNQLKALDSDLITIGSHSLSHPKFTALDKARAEMELVNSKKILEEISGREVGLFCFPYGMYNKQSVKEAYECGYKKVFTIEPAIIKRYQEQFIIGRTAVSPKDWDIEFILKIHGAFSWVSYYGKIKKIIKGKDNGKMGNMFRKRLVQAFVLQHKANNGAVL